MGVLPMLRRQIFFTAAHRSQFLTCCFCSFLFKGFPTLSCFRSQILAAARLCCGHILNFFVILCSRAQYGQPDGRALVRELIMAFHSCPLWQSHQIFRWLARVTSVGWRAPLRIGCHSSATCGQNVLRSLKPGRTFLPVQYGQPCPFTVRSPILL